MVLILRAPLSNDGISITNEVELLLWKRELSELEHATLSRLLELTLEALRPRPTEPQP